MKELAAELKQREEISGAELRERIEAWRMRPACPDMERTLVQPHVEQAALSSLATMS